MNWYKTSQNQGTFLENSDSAWDWAQKNIPDLMAEEEAQTAEEKAYLSIYKERAMAYSDFYNSIKDKKEIIVYRMIRVGSIDELNWEELGVYWSFKKSGAQVLGDAPGRGDYNRDVLISAKISPQVIDWEHGFTSFMYYGEDQFECALIKGSPVEVIAIDDAPISPRQCFASTAVDKKPQNVDNSSTTK